MKRLIMMVLACAAMAVHAQDLTLNDREYFERRGVNVLVFSNSFNGGFNDEKNSGIEIIHHGVRTVQGGAVRLNNTPEQWDLVPKMTDRKVNKEAGSIEVALRYDDYDFDSRVVVTAKGKAVEIAVYLDKPVPGKLAGEAGFNIEFLPSQYWLKTYIMDGRLNRFPRYATSQTVTRPNTEKPRQFKGFRTYDDRGTGRFVDPLPLESGHRIVMATDDPERMITISSDDAELKLYDGRMLAQNGWFVLRSVLPANKTGKVITWTVEPHAIPNWIRQPNIGFSQIGYIPEQPKVAVIELDPNDTPQQQARLMRIRDDGSTEQAFTGAVTTWGMYYKYRYVKFDFSAVREPGIYYIEYGGAKTNNFLIDEHVYDKITDATTDVWVPIHMNHMYVNEGYRTWHGEPFKEGYLQAPESDHFDLHRQGATTDTKYRPLELIPGLNVGGFFDAGDFDIETGSNINVVQNFIRAWELFHPQRDETFVSQQQRYVDLHRPDGVPDILQYIEHGVLNLVAQAERIGHMASTLSNSVLDNYHHLGDAASITDGLHYDPSLKPYEVSADGKRSGTPDDLWAFTTRNPNLDLQAAGIFTSAARVLHGYNDKLADRAQKQADRLRKEAEDLLAQRSGQRDVQAEADNDWLTGTGDGNANSQQASRRARNRRDNRPRTIWESLDRDVARNLQTALDSIPMKDEAYKQKLRPYVVKYNDYIHSFDTQNPYGVPIGLGNWAGVNAVLNFGITVNYAHIYFPDIISKDEVYRVSNWLYGCHPYHNYSFVAVVGATRPKQVFYGNNRADFSAIPGNVAPGLLFRKPDHFENYDDWPFLWGQNEGTIAGNTQYIIFGSALKNIVSPQLTVEQRADHLLKRLTLEEKVKLMMDTSPAIERLGIPPFQWWNEALHGVGRNGYATVFPITMGMAASWDDALLHRVFTAVSDEARVKARQAKQSGDIRRYQSLSFWTPNINIFRDPRWGRGQETYGEDPFLTSKMGLAVVRGLQGYSYDGKPLGDYKKLLACAKHFAVHSGPEWNRHTFNIENLPERDLWETYLPAFKALVQEGEVAEVMCAYQRIDGQPCCSQARYEQQILRDEWGFKGLITSDCGAVHDFLPRWHNTAKDSEEASAQAVLAGTDVECGSDYRHLPEAVRRGDIKEADLDRSLRRLLIARMEVGDFDSDDRVSWTKIPENVVASKEHKQLALDMARKSIVLLKNNGVLPLNSKLSTLNSKLLVMGPNATDSVMQWGNYAGYPTKTVTALEGIRQQLGNVPYVQGCSLTRNESFESRFPEIKSPTGSQGLQAVYYNNTDMAGTPVTTVTLTEPVKLSNGGNTVFAPGVNLENCSARLDGTLIPTRDETLIFTIGGDDKIRLLVNGDTIVNLWQARQRIQQAQQEIVVKAGEPYRIQIEYVQESGYGALNFDIQHKTTPTPQELLAQVGQAETVIFVGGISPRLEGEEMRVSEPGFRGGDRTSIELPQAQRDVLRWLHEAGKKVIFVNCSGGAVALVPELETCDAILQWWYDGEQGGTALADVLTGRYNPSGKLPVTFYRSTDQLPDFLDYTMKNRTYRYFTGEPLFPFGHGLSYTTFTFGNAQVKKAKNDKIEVSVPVKNTGQVDGTETVQVYFRRTADKEGPLKTLCAYQQVTLKAGEARTVTITLPRKSLESWDTQTNTMRFVSGQYQLMVGSSSADNALQTINVKL